MVAPQGDAPAKKSDGGTARGCAGEKWVMGCTSLDRQRWRSDGMRRPKWAMVVRRGDAPAKWSNTKLVGWHECAGKRSDRIGGECAGQVKQCQISGGSVGNAPAKRNNIKLVDRRQMRRPNRTTPKWWIGGKCAGKQKRMRRGDEMRRPNSNT